VLERLEARLADLPVAAAASSGSASTSRSSRSSRGNGAASFVATPTGTMFHLPDCAVVANRPNLRKVRGDERGMEPCKLCDPLSASVEA
jgi:hypothetical protein